MNLRKLNFIAFLALANSAGAEFNHSQLFFDSSSTDQAAYGANQVITISGNITYFGRRDPQPADGAVDFAQPFTDIYIVEHGTHTGGFAPRLDLTDVNGAPNAIFGSSGGSFIEQPIGTTMPSGALKSGEYDVVFDEHQDGAFQSDYDLYNGYGGPAIVVNIPFDAPVPPPTGILLLKLQASQQMVSAAGAREAFKAFKSFTDPQGQLLDAYTKWVLGTATPADFAFNIVGVLSEPVGLAIGIVKKYVTERNNVLKNWDDYAGMPLSLAENVLENRVKRVTGMAADPPDPNYGHSVLLTRSTVMGKDIYDPLNRAWSVMMVEMDRSERLSAALLSALEKYQGAQGTHGYWALAHARECRHFAMLLADQMEKEAATMTAFRSALAAHPFDLDAIASALRVRQARLAATGFSAEEKLLLAAMGATGAQADGIMAELLAENHSFSKTTALSKLDADLVSLAAGPARWREFAATWEGVITTLMAEPTIDDGQPLIVLPAGVTGAARLPLSFQAHVSQARSLPLLVEWDFDEDGEFDDAVGATAQNMWQGRYNGLVGARVTSSGGRTAYAWMMVTVTDANHPPAFTSLSPLRGLVVSEGTAPLVFGATASDPDGESTALTWSLDNVTVGTGGSYTYTPATTGEGHVLRVTAGDGKSKIERTWIIAVKSTGSPAPSDLALTVEAPETPIQAGSEFTWTMTVENRGPGAAANVVVTQVLPAGMTFVRSSTSFGTSIGAGNQVTANFGTVAPGGLVTLWVQTTAAAPGSFQCAGRVVSETMDFDTANNNASARVRVNPPSPQAADLRLAAAVAPSPATVGGTQTITFTTSNAGPDGATGLVLETQLPESVDFVSSTPAALSSDDGLVRIPLLDTGSGADTVATLVVRPTKAGTGPAYAQVYASQGDPALNNNQTEILLSAVFTPTPASDLVITQAPPVSARVGLPATWTITVTNNGPDAAEQVSLHDVLPAGATFSGASTAPASLGNGRAGFMLGTLAPGASRSVSVTVEPQAAGEAVNRVTASSASRDTNEAESISKVEVQAPPSTSADLSATLTAAPAAPALNGQVTLTLTLSNAGPDAATAVHAVTRLPDGLAFVSANGGATHDGGVVRATASSLASGAQAVFTLIATAQAARSFAVVSDVHSEDRDPASANNRAIAVVTVQDAPPQPVDLALTQSTRSSVTLGDAFKVTLVVTNRGPGAATGVTITHTLPASISFIAGTSGHSTVTHNAGVVTASLGTLAVNESTTVELTLAAEAAGLAMLGATVSAGEIESAPHDNAAALTVTVLPAGPVELKATYRFDDTLAACEPDAPPLVAIDPANADAFITVDVNGRTRRVYRWNGSPDSAAAQAGLTLSTAGLLPRDNYSVELLFRFSEANNARRSILQTANRTGDHSLDVSPQNRILVSPLTDGPASFITGKFHHVALTVSGGTVTTWLDGVLQRSETTGNLDIAPEELLHFFVDNDEGEAQNDYSDGEIALLRVYEGALPPNRIAAQAAYPFGPDEPMDVNAQMIAARNPVDVWIAGFSTTRGTPFIQSPNVSDSDTRWYSWSGTGNGPHIYRNRLESAISHLTIIQPPDLLGMDPSLDGRNAVVRWTAPAGGTYRIQGRWQGIDVSPNGTDVALLRNGSTGTTLFEDYVLGYQQRKPFDLTVMLSMGETVDFSLGRGGNSNLYDSTGLDAVITPVALTDDCADGTDLAVTQTPMAKIVVPGETFALELSVTNAGLRPAPDVILTDIIPAGLTFVSASAENAIVQASGNGATLALGMLAPGETRAVSVLLTGNAAGVYTNVARVAGGSFDPALENNEANATVTLGGVVPLVATVRTTVDSSRAGDEVVFEFVMSNSGTLAAPGCVLSAALPAGTEFVSATGGGTRQNATIVFPARSLAVGETAGYSLRLRGNVPGPLTLTALASSTSPSVRESSGSASLTILPATVPPDLQVAVSTTPAQLFAGCRFTATYTVTNTSPTPAANVTLRGFFPDTLVVISTTASQGTATVTDGQLAATLGQVRQGSPVTVTVQALATAAEVTGLSANVSGLHPFATVPAAVPAGLVHLWDFNEAAGSAFSDIVLQDRVGAAHGTVRGSGAFTTGSGVELPGGDPSSAPYIDLPNGLVSSLHQVTFEGWLTVNALGTRWGHVFSFGSSEPGGANGELIGPGNTNGGGEAGLDYFSLTTSIETNDQSQRFAVRNGDPGGPGESWHDSNSPTVVGQPIHFAVTVDTATPGLMTVRYYRDGVFKGELANLPFNLSDLNDVNNWLGRGNWTGYPHVPATFEEFRLYDRALTAPEIEASRLAGPDALTLAVTGFSDPAITTPSTASVLHRRDIAIPPPGTPCAIPVALSIFAAPEQESYRLEWTASPGRKFLIQSSPDLLRWINVPTLHTATQPLENWIDPGPPSTEINPVLDGVRFYRVLELAD